MNTRLPTWYAVSLENETTLDCAACAAEIDLHGPMADHHSRVCPACGVDCTFLDWKGRIIQIVTNKAPKALAEALRWAQAHLDELEYVELLCALEELADILNGIVPHTTNQTSQAAPVRAAG